MPSFTINIDDKGKAKFIFEGTFLSAMPRHNQPSKPKRRYTREDRIKWIERQLDICKGRVPTPKGYNIDKTKIKALIIELRDLQNA
jgi:hypothetical protein